MTDDTTQKPEANSEPELPEKTLKEFLESVPPDTLMAVTDAIRIGLGGRGTWLNSPSIELHCEKESCNGVRIFESGDEPHVAPKLWEYAFLKYKCRNCKVGSKLFALYFIQPDEGYPVCVMKKLGENPTFGSPTPPRLISFVGPQRDLYLKGRRSENRGLGIGAFAYYRRIVEDQWKRILGEVEKAAKRLGASAAVLKQLETAKSRKEFSRAVDDLKDALPDSLRIGGQNPLTLLHGAISENLHDRSDEECLELARDVRLILTRFADTVSQALDDQAEIQTAVKRLLKKQVLKAPDLEEQE
jgi:hypothetical protein